MKTIGNIRRQTYHLLFTVITLIALAATNALADKYKANNTSPLNQTASWTNNAVPTSTEFGVWDINVSATKATNSLGASMTWGGIKILNPGGPVTLTSGFTLTLAGVGGIGIDMSSASQNLTVNCALGLSAPVSFIDPTNWMLTANGPISGLGSLTKAGTGVVVLGGACTYTGNTTVSVGTLQVNGSLSSATAVTVQPGATLSGVGTINGPVTVMGGGGGGRLAPGIGGIGILTVNNSLTLLGNAVMEINRTGTPNCDRVTGVSSLTYGGTLTVNNLGSLPQGGDAFTLFSAATYSGSFTNVILPALSSGMSWDTSTLAVDGTIRVMQFTNYTINVGGCCSLIANQLNNPGGNSLANLMPTLPCDCRLMKFDNPSQTWITTTYSTLAGWANGAITLNPGEGAFLCLCCTSNFSITFSGYVPTPSLPVTMILGKVYLLSRQFPGPGTYDNIVGLSPGPGDIAYTWTNCTWFAHIYDPDFLTWDPSDPTTAIGQAMFINPQGQANFPTLPNLPCPTNDCVPPPSALTAWWPFDETTGSIANDLVGVNNKGTYMGSPTHAVGMVSNALCFNGTSDYVLVPNQAEINFVGTCPNTAESFTIDAWVRVNATSPPDQTLLEKRVNVSTAPQGYNMFLYNGCLGFQLADGVNWVNHLSASPDLRDGQWHFIVVTVARCTTNGNLVTLYVDGAPVSTSADTIAGDLNNSADLKIGQPDPVYGYSYFSGCLDELEFFKRVLSPAELHTLFIAGSRGKCKNGCLLVPIINCVTNKTITCGTQWWFDWPTASDACCGTTPAIGLVSTNATVLDACHTLWQGIFTATNCSGLTASCTQLVTVVSPTPPSITCMSRTISTGATNCYAYLPDLRVPPSMGTAGNTNLDPNVSVRMATKVLPPMGYDLDHPTNSFPVAYISATDLHAIFTNADTTKYVLSNVVHRVTQSATFVTNGPNITETFGSELTAMATITPPVGPVVPGVYIQATGAVTVVVSNYSGGCGDFQTAMTSMSMDGVGTVGGVSTPFHLGVSSTKTSSGRTIVTNCTPGDPTIISGFNVYPVLSVNGGAPMEAQGPVWVQVQPVTGGLDIQSCSPIASVTQDPPPGIIVGPGWFPVTITVVDTCGQSNQCFTWVQVQDTSPPILTCATNKTILCGGKWSFDQPGAWDVCCGTNVTFWLASSNCTVVDSCHSLCQGIWDVWDCNGNLATCTQLVTVVSPTPPSITCTPRTLTITGPTCQTTMPDLRVPPSMGTPGSTNLDPKVSVRMASKVLPPMGYDLDHPTNSFPVAYISATDLHAIFTNADTTKYVLSNVVHRVTQSATFVTNGPNITETFGSELTAVATIFAPPAFTYSGVIIQATGQVTVVVSNYSGGCGDFQTAMTSMSMDGVGTVGGVTTPFHLGVSSTKTSGGRTIVTNCTPGDPTIISGFNVYPVLSVNGGAAMEAQGPVWVQVQPVTGGLDIQSCSPIAFISQDPPPGTPIGPGFTAVTITAVDTCLHSNQCFTWVNVTAPPILACATNKTVICGYPWSFDPPSFTDVCCGPNVTVTLISTNGTVLDGCRTLCQGVWNAVNCLGNSATCTQWVTVVKLSPPVITLLPPYLQLGVPNAACTAALPDLRSPPEMGLHFQGTNFNPRASVNMATKALPPIGHDLDHPTNAFPVAYISYSDAHALFTNNTTHWKYVLSSFKHEAQPPVTRTTNGTVVTEIFNSELTGRADVTDPSGTTYHDVYIDATGLAKVVVSNYTSACGDFQTVMSSMSLDGTAALSSGTVPFHLSVSTNHPSNGRTIITNCVGADPTIISGFNIYPVLSVGSDPPMEAQGPVWVQAQAMTSGIQVTGCTAIATVTQSPPPGTPLNPGDHWVTVTAVDSCGQSSQVGIWVSVAVTRPIMTITEVGGTMVLTWSGGGMLSQADAVTGPWTNIPDATSPYTVSSLSKAKFYCIRGCK